MKFLLAADRSLTINNDSDFYEVINLYEAHKKRSKEEDKIAEEAKRRKSK